MRSCFDQYHLITQYSLIDVLCISQDRNSFAHLEQFSRIFSYMRTKLDFHRNSIQVSLTFQDIFKTFVLKSFANSFAKCFLIRKSNSKSSFCSVGAIGSVDKIIKRRLGLTFQKLFYLIYKLVVGAPLAPLYYPTSSYTLHHQLLYITPPAELQNGVSIVHLSIWMIRFLDWIQL